MANDGRDKTAGSSKRFYEIYRTKNKAGFNKESSCCFIAFQSGCERQGIPVLGKKSLSVELNTLEMLKQKLEYIHYNPVLAGLCNLPEEYKYSTARLYETGVNDWSFVTHYTE